MIFNSNVFITFTPKAGNVFVTISDMLTLWSDDILDDKDKILAEMCKLRTRLETNGTNCDGMFFGVRSCIGDMQDESKMLWEPEDNFVKVFPRGLMDIVKDLTGPETLVVLAMVPHISYESGLLKKANGYPITIHDISISVNAHEKTIIKTMTKLVAKMVFYRGKTGEKNTHQFYANPYIFMKGKYINKTLHDMFKDYKRR